MKPLAILLIVATACSSSAVPRARFANKNPVLAVDDRRDVPVRPARREHSEMLYHFDGSFRDPLTRPLELQRARRAEGVNALDEVPDSAWFTNRIGVRELSADEIRRGPTTIDNPETHLPWTIVGTKSKGEALGLFIEDARKERFLVKFDRKGFPEVETAAHVISGRLLWACGYNVPEDFIAYVRLVDLEIAPTATWEDEATGRIRRLDRSHLRTMLAGVQVDNGSVRVLASRMVPGTALGGHPDEGVRADDPNDRIPHELRRDLRGARPIFAWLDNVDVKESNTLDSWEVDPRDPRRHFVRHYFLDFGKSLGAMARLSQDPTRAYEYMFDFDEMGESLVSLGFRDRAWDRRSAPRLVGVGMFERDLDAHNWKPTTPAYRPFLEADRFDWLWGAKLVVRFKPDQLRAAVEMGRLSDPRAVDYIVEALIVRQRIIANHAFSRQRPLDNFTIADNSSLCFDDLMVRHQLNGAANGTRYTVTSFDRRGRRLAARTLSSTPSGQVCTVPLPVARARENYTIWRVAAVASPGATFVHVARNPVTSELRVIGVWRD
jgi:hypothetical protein